MQRRQVDVLPLRFQQRGSLFAFPFRRLGIGPFFGLGIGPFLLQDHRRNADVLRRNRRSHYAAGRDRGGRNYGNYNLHDNIRSSCLIRCSTCPLAVPPI